MKFAAPDVGSVPGSRTTPPTFSVLISAFQVARYIGRAVGSALEQTEPPFEVVVCDDGSTDDIMAALEPYMTRIKLIRKENGGEASAKNAAARAASGEFVVFLDGDDAYLPGRLEALGRLATIRPDLDILTTDAYIELDGTILRNVYTDSWPFYVEEQRRSILEHNFVFGHAAVKRNLLLEAGGFDEGIDRTTDWECWIRLILEGASVGAVLEPLSYYTVRRSSLSADRTGMLAGGIRTLRKTLDHPWLTPGERSVAVRSIADLEARYGMAILRQALMGGERGARRKAIALAFARSTPRRGRVIAWAGAIAPRAVGGIIRRRTDSTGQWVGAGGTTVGPS
jgi:hypothetical protein